MSDDRSGPELYVVYWIDEQGYAGSLEFVRASSAEEARERSSYASGGVAHQRLVFEGTISEFREYVESEIEEGDDDRFSIAWE